MLDTAALADPDLDEAAGDGHPRRCGAKGRLEESKLTGEAPRQLCRGVPHDGALGRPNSGFETAPFPS